jgi:hypothetical protein
VLLFALDLAAQETQFYAPNKHLSGAGKEEANEAFLDAVARYLNCAKVELQATHRGTHGPLTVPKANALLAAHYLVAYGSTPNCARALNINQSTATRRAAHGHGVHRVQVDNAFRAYDADARDGVLRIIPELKRIELYLDELNRQPPDSQHHRERWERYRAQQHALRTIASFTGLHDPEQT